MKTNLSNSSEATDLSPLEDARALLDIDRDEIIVQENAHSLLESNGGDRFEARIREFPGLVAFGPTKDAARDLLIDLASADVRSASEDRRQKLHAIQLQVQFNHRISVQQKLEIARRARGAGVSVRQFVLNQCLKAPIWNGALGATLSEGQLEQLYRSTAEDPDSGKPGENPRDRGTT